MLINRTPQKTTYNQPRDIKMTNELTIKTNNIPRATLSGYELTPKEQAEFDYIEDLDSACGRFARYKGWTYDLHEFMPTTDIPSGHKITPISEWQGYHSDSFFSGVLINYVGDDCEEVIMGTYYS
jgi:hypothetical protein